MGAGLLALTAGTAHAAGEVTVAGTDTVTFTLGVHPNLSYTPQSSFSTTTTNHSGTIDLGTFTLAPAFFGVDAGFANANITFTQPIVIQGGQQTVYSAGYAGGVSFLGGLETVAWLTPAQTFSYVDGSNSGSFRLTLEDTTLTTSQTGELYGKITRADSFATPEPSSVAPFAFAALGLGGLILRARKRRAA